jgi:hypothetical protein
MNAHAPAPSPIPRPAGTPRPGPASIDDFSSPPTGGGPSTLTLTIVSPRRITRPRVRFCCTVGAASFSPDPFVFFPYIAREPRRLLCYSWEKLAGSGLRPTLTVRNSSHSARTKFICLSYANI